LFNPLNIPFAATVCGVLNPSANGLGIPLFFNRGKEQDNSYSIDRKDSTKGYNIDNIIVISNKANKLKNDATTDQLNKIAAFYSG
jgi:hypothetical protein